MEGRMSALLTTEGLGKHFSGLQALQNVSFEVGEGEIIGVIGPNGAGKSTMFNCIAGAFPPSAGRVTFAGEDVTGLEAHHLARRGMARTFQLMKPFTSMTTLENVVVATLSRHRQVGSARQDAAEVLERVGLAEWSDRQAEDLSTAGRKRLELARAIALRPRLLLLDEVMSGLVPTEREPVLDLLKTLRDDGMTLMFVEHVMQAVMRLSDRIVVLHHGELLASGTPDVVTSDPRVVDAYLGEAPGVADS
jgi:branched-chain amino acid transport system ATP-binding protein